MRSFVELFARSPFEPLAGHGERVHAVLRKLPEVTEAFLTGDRAAVARLHEEISDLEHEADEAKEEIRDHLPKSIFLPVDRGDLLRFLREQDGIADGVEDVAVLMAMRDTRLPDAAAEALRALVDQVMTTGASWYELSRTLPHLQQASFTGPEVDRALELCGMLHRQEHEADVLQAAFGEACVAGEDAIGPIGFYFIMRIANALGRIANRAENTADLVRMMISPR
ncbi:MAG: TIGR00153 family protein [Gemmatimonadetes bacterium]|nr:MAG: TIGR00153 family protein [Gemmatimonadota bacterium]